MTVSYRARMTWTVEWPSPNHFNAHEKEGGSYPKLLDAVGPHYTIGSKAGGVKIACMWASVRDFAKHSDLTCYI